MTKLEKSIRHEMKIYGPELRSGKYYGVCGHTVGDVPLYGFISLVCARVKDGICTDVNIYTVGDAFTRADYYGEDNDLGMFVNITEEVENYILDNSCDWNDLISDIVEKAKQPNLDEHA